MKRNRMSALLLAVSMACSLPAVYTLQAQEVEPSSDEAGSETVPAQTVTEEETKEEPAETSEKTAEQTDTAAEENEASAKTEEQAQPAADAAQVQAETAAAPAQEQSEPAQTEAAVQDGEASVDGQVYATLQEAINAAAENATVTLLKDVTATQSIQIAQGKNLTLALNGHNLDGNGLNGAVLTVAGTVRLKGAGAVENGLTGIRLNAGGNLTLSDNVQILNNGAKSTGWNGSGIWTEGGTLQIDGATFQGNNSRSGGGAITMNNKTTAVINDVLIDGNTSTLGGGGIYYSNSDLTINGGTISNNTAISASTNTNYRPTGGITEHGTSSLTITGGTVSGNKGSYVGAIFTDSNVNTIDISNINMTANVGGLSGGLVTDAYTTVNITGGTYTNNSTDRSLSSFWYQYGDGGAIAVTGGGGEQYGELHINGSAESPVIITGNTNQGSGGGVFLQGNLTTTISGNVIITDNQAGTIGGGVRICDPQNVTTIDPDVKICNNIAKDSGYDIASTNDAPLTINAKAPEEMLTTNGEPQRQITGWYYDGSPEIDGVAQTDPKLWSVNPDTYYAQEFTALGQPVGSIGLRAAYALQVNVILNMIDEQGNVLDSKTLETLPAMTDYDITSQIPETFKDTQGQTLKLTAMPDTAKGKTSTEDLTVNAVYEKVSVGISYTPVDKDGNPIDDPKDILTDQNPGTEYDVTKDIPQTIEKDGVLWKLKEVPDNAKGTTGEENVMIYPVYEQVQPDIILQPVDRNGNPITNPTTVLTDGKPGDEYDVKDKIPASITIGEDTYKLVGMPADATGTLGEDDITIKPVYERVSVTVTIQPVGPDGNPISHPVPGISDGKPGQDYDVSTDVPSTITDENGTKWVLVTVEDNAKGKLGDSNVVVKAWYKKASATVTPSKPGHTSVSKPNKVQTAVSTGIQAAASAGVLSLLGAWLLKRRNRNK